jgi:hypothetical protein
MGVLARMENHSTFSNPWCTPLQYSICTHRNGKKEEKQGNKTYIVATQTFSKYARAFAFFFKTLLRKCKENDVLRGIHAKDIE